MNQIKIGKFITQLRKEKGMTQQQLAEMLGVSDRSVSRWENGINLPDVSLFDPLCTVFDIGLDELLAGERNKTDKLIQTKNRILCIVFVISIIFAGIIGYCSHYYLFGGENALADVEAEKNMQLSYSEDNHFEDTHAFEYKLPEKKGYHSAMVANVGFYFPIGETVSVSEMEKGNCLDRITSCFRDDMYQMFYIHLNDDHHNYEFIMTVIPNTNRMIFEKKTGIFCTEDNTVSRETDDYEVFDLLIGDSTNRNIIRFGDNTCVIVTFLKNGFDKNILNIVKTFTIFEKKSVGYLTIKKDNTIAREEPTVSCSNYTYLDKGDIYTVENVVNSNGFTWYEINGIGYVNPTGDTTAEFTLN